MPSDAFLTTDEVLSYLHVNLRTVYRLIKAGKLPAVRVGRQWRFRKRDIDAVLEGPRPRAVVRSMPFTGRQIPQEPQRPRVLIVDQEQDVREELAKGLELAEYDVHLASDGRAALERLRQGACDLLITDLRVPGMDGLSLIREGRRVKPDLPAIILTGYSSEAAAIEAANLGVSGYLTKPVRVPRVLAAAARALAD